jgi:hypothetical protein
VTHRIFIAATAVATLAISSIASAQTSPNHNQPITQADILVSLGGDVTAQIAPFAFQGSPSYTNEMFYVSPASTGLGTDTYIGGNRDFQSSAPAVDLGTIGLGQEVLLGLGTNYNGNGILDSANYDNFWLTGPGSRNADGQIHAFMTNLTSNSVEVDFEDLPNGSSDWNYGDASVIVTGAQAVPEPASYAILGVGALGLIRRRKQK